MIVEGHFQSGEAFTSSVVDQGLVEYTTCSSRGTIQGNRAGEPCGGTVRGNRGREPLFKVRHEADGEKEKRAGGAAKGIRRHRGKRSLDGESEKEMVEGLTIESSKRGFYL